MSFALLTPAGANPLSVLSLRLALPLRGAWYGEIELDAKGDETPLVRAQATLAMGGRVWSGYLLRVREFAGRTRCFFEAGKGGMRSTVPALQYDSALVRTIAAQIVSIVGETLSGTASKPTDVLERYHRIEARAGVALSSILSVLGWNWRFTDAGAVWWGAEGWGAASETDVLELEPFGESAETIVQPLSPTLSPGSTFGGRKIERIVYSLSEDEPLSARLVFLRDGGGELRGALSRAVRAVVPELPYFARYPARVVSQGEDGRLELAPDDPTVAGSPPVAPLYGLPGVRCEVDAGARVGLVHEAGDARRPRAMGWEQETPATVIELEASDEIKLGASATRGVVRLDDLGHGGTFSSAPPPATLLWTGADGSSWTITMVAGANPVTATITPGVGTPGKIVTKADNASSSVKAKD